jgi:PiT family inorganic phosphate transporter
MSAESSSAAIILLSAQFGYALSTTQVVTGSVLGSGVGKPGAEVRWNVAGRMATAWLITLPSAGLVGAITYSLVHFVGGFPGAILGVTLLLCVAGVIYVRSRKNKVDASNVNDDWEGGLTAGLDSAEPAGAVVPAHVGAGTGGNGHRALTNTSAVPAAVAPTEFPPIQDIRS